MDDRSELLSDLQVPVSASGDCEGLSPPTALFTDVKEVHHRPQIDSVGAMDGGADSMPKQGNAEAQSVVPELENNDSPTDLSTKDRFTTVEPSENDDNMIAAGVGVHTECHNDDSEIYLPSVQQPQAADDVPLLDLSADIEASPLIQSTPTDPEITQSGFADPHDDTQLLNATRAEIFLRIYNTAANHDQDNDSKNKCDIACGKACYVANSGGCQIRTLLTGSLIRGRDIGWIIFCGIVFPLVSVINRRVWIASLWLSAIILVCLSLATAIANGTEIPYIVGILLCGIFVTYCVIDTLGTEVCHFQLRAKNTKLYTQHMAHEGDNGVDEQAANGIRKWEKVTNIFDFVRLIVPELVLFPIVVCDLYSLVVYRSYSGQPATHLINYVKLLVSSMALVIHSHIVRSAVIATTVHRLHTQQTPPSELFEHSNEASQQVVFDSSLRQAGLRYWKVFVVHVILQILNQALLTIALGFKLQDYLIWTEALNHDPNLYFNEKSTIKVELAIFMVGAYLLPICGFWLFFAVTHYWLHEFLIGLTVDFISMVQLHGASQYFFMDNGDEKLTKTLEYVDFDNLKRDYNEFRMIQTFIDKGLYPLRNYVLTLLCTAYMMLQIVYLSFAVLDIKNRDTVNAIFYVFAVIGEVISSFSAFFVGVFWILFFSIALLLLCGMCTKQCESPSNYNYTVRPYNSYPVQQPYFTTGPQTTPRISYVQRPSYFTTGPQHTPRINSVQRPSYFTTVPQHTPGLDQSVVRRQPTSGSYYPSFSVSGQPTAR